MNEIPRICFTCGKGDIFIFHKLDKLDRDKISYLEKLKYCFGNDLMMNTVLDGDMEICSMCVRDLRVSYKFKVTVCESQECLLKTQVECDTKDNLDFCETKYNSSIEKIEIVSGDCGVDDYVFEGDSSEDINDAIDLLTKKINIKREKRKNSKEHNETITCSLCDFICKKNWQLRKHLQSVHNDYTKFSCSYCGKEFKKAFHLKEHVSSHTGEKNYSCSICGKTFMRQSSQKRHIKSHDRPPGHKTKRTPFLCTICGKSFPFSNGVQRHMRIHLGIKKYECKHCNRKFRQSTHLQVHMRTHTGEKPYICDTCGEKFSLKSCMDKHILSRHPRTKTDIKVLLLSEFEDL